MAEKEVKLMKGNEVIAHAAIRYGCDGYFGYPITPQSEVMETLMELKPWETTGMVVLQAEYGLWRCRYGQASDDFVVESGCEPYERRIELFGRCRVAMSDCELPARWPGTRNYPALAG